jgi:hypothetical protein
VAVRSDIADASPEQIAAGALIFVIVYYIVTLVLIFYVSFFADRETPKDTKPNDRPQGLEESS